ncbi:hypothetical protein V8G54_022727 [Vigna mungo]|uniref:Uncharacterized protein n=1 Tax=Vigna mungo TaxID=3915 RepID=A0AAQ3RRX4_VIGMU
MVATQPLNYLNNLLMFIEKKGNMDNETRLCSKLLLLVLFCTLLFSSSAASTKGRPKMFIGSEPPTCFSKCEKCTPCKPIIVSPPSSMQTDIASQRSHDFDSEPQGPGSEVGDHGNGVGESDGRGSGSGGRGSRGQGVRWSGVGVRWSGVTGSRGPTPVVGVKGSGGLGVTGHGSGGRGSRGRGVRKRQKNEEKRRDKRTKKRDGPNRAMSIPSGNRSTNVPDGYGVVTGVPRYQTVFIPSSNKSTNVPDGSYKDTGQ